MTEEERQAVLAKMTEDERLQVAWAESEFDKIASGMALMIHGAIIQEKSKEEVDKMIDETFNRHKEKWMNAGMPSKMADDLALYIYKKVIDKGKEYCFEMFGEVAGHA